MDKWYQMWVSHKSLDKVKIMQRCDPILQKFNCLPCAPPPEGIPILCTDGTIEVRGFNEMGFGMAKRYLQDQGFTIEREQVND